MINLNNCTICPRRCGANRYENVGLCGEGAQISVSKIMLHHYEEPCISGTAGSGAIFFSGCSLHCVYCQNRDISCGGAGQKMTEHELADEMLRLEDMGAHNINLVTPTHFTVQIIKALDIIKKSLTIPVIFNTSGYETVETIKSLDGYADIFLTDFKYGTAALAAKYSSAPDYPKVASAALPEMLKITGVPVLNSDGMLVRGTVLRHLVLPGNRHDSIEALHLVAATIKPNAVILSLMRQYTPDFTLKEYTELGRRVTTFEYNSVLNEALQLGFDGYSQEKDSAKSIYTPDFKAEE